MTEEYGTARLDRFESQAQVYEDIVFPRMKADTWKLVHEIEMSFDTRCRLMAHQPPLVDWELKFLGRTIKIIKGDE